MHAGTLPSSGYLGYCSFDAAGPSHREPGDGKSGGNSHALLQPIQFTSTTRTCQLKTAAGVYFRYGEGVSFKLLRFWLNAPIIRGSKPSKVPRAPCLPGHSACVREPQPSRQADSSQGAYALVKKRSIKTTNKYKEKRRREIETEAKEEYEKGE